MNKQKLKFWINTLRSGEYTQGKGQLRTKRDEFCCLGVLCELYRKSGEPGAWADGYFETCSPEGKAESEAGLPPRLVTEWLGYGVNDIYVPVRLALEQMSEEWLWNRYRTTNLDEILETIQGPTWSVSYLNDSGATFTEIANILEKAFLSDEQASPQAVD